MKCPTFVNCVQNLNSNSNNLNLSIMKKLTHALIFIGLIISFSALAQVVPNAGFEEWETNQTGGMQPVGWQAISNSAAFSNVFEVDGYNGGSAAQLVATNIPGVGVLAPSLFSDYFAVEQNYAKLSGYVKGAPVGNDTLYIVVGMYQGNSQLVGAGLAFVAQEVNDFSEFSVNIFYDSKAVPDSCNITFIAGSMANTGFANEGTSFTVDELELSGIASVQDMSPVFNEVGQPYPSPADDYINIPFQLAEPDDISVMVVDITGKVVYNRSATLFGTGSNEISLETSRLPVGTYICTLIPSDGRSVTRKFMVQ